MFNMVSAETLDNLKSVRMSPQGSLKLKSGLGGF